VLVKQDEIGMLAGLNAADPVVHEHLPGGINSDRPDRFVDWQSLSIAKQCAGLASSVGGKIETHDGVWVGRWSIGMHAYVRDTSSMGRSDRHVMHYALFAEQTITQDFTPMP
jgi:hypothetical protein